MDVLRCGSCGEANPARARFCLACGTPLAAPAADGESREVRKTLTVLFADMVGFTELGDRLDEESLRRVMDRFYAEMRGAIEAEGGTVAKFIGDAVMAVWGTPTVQEDDALRAVRAAEGMRQALRVLNEDILGRWGATIALRTGVNTGETVVDPSKSADLLVGDALNVAARLEQAAGPGEVLVGAETFRLVRDDARLEPVAPLDVKGKARPVPAFRLVDGSRRERRSESRLQAPLVGRARELARLHAALDAATAASETRVVSLIGSPGVGKTRLVNDFANALGESATVVRGHCEATGEGLTFLPVAEVVRTGAGIHEGDSPESARYKLEAVLPEDDPVRDHVVDRALGLVGLGTPVSVEESFWAVRRFLEGLARLRRLVVLLDDVHWGQPTFLDLIQHLAAWGRDAPILVVTLGRPELREIRPALTERNEAVSEVIALGPLQPNDSKALVDRLLGEADLPPELAERVLETTEGNPLFLGEMLRMLVDDGVLERSGDRWIARDAGGVVVPPTVHALLAARIERLSDGERAVVERAAVIGQQFFVGAVAELCPPAHSERVAEHLDRLRRKELVSPEGTLWEGEEVFRFHHVLIRDAAYRSLLKEARADLHERFAGWLEGREGDHEELVALHLERAHAYREELGPLDDRGRALASRAAERLHLAGRRALEREDLPAAENLLTRALHPLDVDDPRRQRVLADLAETQLSAGDTAAAEETVEELTLRAEATADGPQRALAIAFACQLAILTGAGQVHDTIALATEAARVLEEAGEPAAQAKAHHVAATAHSLLGEIAAAETELDRALVAARTARDQRRVTAVLSGAPRAALWGPSPIVRASGRCLDVVRILRMTPGNRHVEASALRCQAVLEAMRGRPEASREIIATCRATLEELGLTLELLELETYAGIVELLAGDARAAELHLVKARDGFRALGVDSGASQASALLARALIEQARFHDAEDESRHAERHAGEDLKAGIAWRGVRAEALARRGEHREAERVAREAVALAEPTDALADKADALMALANVLRTCGHQQPSREAAQRAHALYVAKDHTVGAMRARAALGGRPAGTSTEVPEPAFGDSEVERMWRAYCDAFTARDWDGVRRLVTDDVALLDHRGVWPEVRGVEPFLDQQRSGAAIAPDAAMSVESVIDADDDLAAVVTVVHARAHEGAPATRVSLGVLTRLRDGRVERVELFDHVDEEGMRARLEELRGERGGALADVWHAYERYVNEHDFDGLASLYAEDYELVDHRQLGWGRLRGRAAALDLVRTALATAPDMTTRIDAILGSDEQAGVTAGRIVLHATTEGGGEAETVLSLIAVVRDGLVIRNEFFDPGDEAALVARYEEVRSERRSARRAVAPRSRERFERWAAAASAGRFDELQNSEDFELDDHRLGGAATAIARDVGGNGLRGVHETASDVRFEPELIAGLDDGTADVAAARVLVSGESRFGGGRFEVPYLSVSAARGDVPYRVELFEPGEEDALLARFDELCAEAFGGVTLSPLAREPIVPEAVAHESRWTRQFNAREFDAIEETWAPDILVVDHRELGWEEIRGHDAMAAMSRSVAEFAQNIVVSAEMVAGTVSGDRMVHAAITTYVADIEDLGAGVVRAGWLTCVTGGLIDRMEVFADDDVEAMLARYRELVEPQIDGWLAALNSKEPERIRRLLADEFTLVDHRPIGWETLTRPDLLVDRAVSLSATSEDAHWTGDVLDLFEEDGHRVELIRVRVGGTIDGAPWEMVFVSVGVLENGLRTRFDIFEPDDDEGIRAAFDEQVGRYSGPPWPAAPSSPR